MARIVETDNYGGDYPDEKFLNLPRMSIENAEHLANVINEVCCSSRYWKVVNDDYVLQPGFEP